jgi:hypothetical protein
VAAAALTALGGARAKAGDEPVVYDFWLDGGARPHPKNHPPDGFLEGDSITVHIDPTRLFPGPETGLDDLGFDPDKAPPETLGFYVTGPSSGVAAAVSMQPGLCVVDATKAAASDAVAASAKAAAALTAANADPNASVAHKAQAKKTADDAAANALRLGSVLTSMDKASELELPPGVPNKTTATTGAVACSPAESWTLNDHSIRPYVCGADHAAEALLKTDPTWSLVKTGVRGDLVCLRSWRLKAGPVVTAVTAEITVGQNAPQSVTFAKEDKRWSTTVALKRDTSIRVKVQSDNETRYAAVPLKVSARDTHSLVRLQGEILATNRLRAVSFAVAVTPVARSFFTQGPGFECIVLCAVTPTALLRLSGDDKTLVQFGAGLGLNLSQAFQMNGGVLFGTADVNTAWRLERSWYLGLAVDPLILSEAWTAKSTGSAPKN